jgi:hypothetical protein
VPIRHRTEGTRIACASRAGLQRAFGAAWKMVSRVLTILTQVANLAEVAQFASVTLRRVADVSRVALYVIRCGSVEIMLEGVATTASADREDARHDELNLLQRIQAIVIESITVTAPIPA